MIVVVTISTKEDYHLWRLFNQAYRIAMHVLSVIKFPASMKVMEGHKEKSKSAVVKTSVW